ncbi:MAG: hypothetical protein H6718_21915 [Polyangiaceae bacterium]|nr:hypothetical protein [Polyangiaceae bacterium]
MTTKRLSACCGGLLLMLLSGSALAEPGAPKDEASAEPPADQDVRLLLGGGMTRGAHTDGFSGGLELNVDFDALQAVALGQASTELFGGGDNQRIAVGVGPRFRLGRFNLSVAPIVGYARYTLREGCLIFCDTDRPTEHGASSFAGGHAGLSYSIPIGSGGLLLGLSGDATHDLAAVASEAPGWQYTWLLNAGAYFNL